MRRQGDRSVAGQGIERGRRGTPVSHGPEAATKEAPESPDAVESAAEGRGGRPRLDVNVLLSCHSAEEYTIQLVGEASRENLCFS